MQWGAQRRAPGFSRGEPLALAVESSQDGAVEDGLYFRQLSAGRDFAVGNQFAVTMRNHVYVIGDVATREVLLVDPAYDVAGLLGWLDDEGLRLIGVVATHYHADHVGGEVFGQHVQGLVDLLEADDVPVHVQKAEVPWVSEMSGAPVPALVPHEDDDVIKAGSVEVRLLHTPGHSPGSQCLWAGDNLITGDTLFIDGCGRTDLPGADGEAMYLSLRRLAHLPASLVVWPGHNYSPARSAPLEDLKHTNPVLGPLAKEEWQRRFVG